MTEITQKLEQLTKYYLSFNKLTDDKKPIIDKLLTPRRIRQA